MKKSFALAPLLAVAVLIVVSCTAEKPATSSTTESLPAGLILGSAPAAAPALLAVKGSAKAGDQVTFRARIGGRAEPFVEGRAMMIVIDPALPSCADNPGDGCPVPWDYCCESQETLLANSATVRLVDDAGATLGLSLKDNSGLSALAWITVVGTVAERDASGLFLVDATGIYIEKQG